MNPEIPDWCFKEVLYPEEVLSRLPEERGLWYESPEEREERWRREEWKERVLPEVLRIAKRRLTPSQYRVLSLFLSVKKA